MASELTNKIRSKLRSSLQRVCHEMRRTSRPFRRLISRLNTSTTRLAHWSQDTHAELRPWAARVITLAPAMLGLTALSRGELVPNTDPVAIQNAFNAFGFTLTFGAIHIVWEMSAAVSGMYRTERDQLTTIKFREKLAFAYMSVWHSVVILVMMGAFAYGVVAFAYAVGRTAQGT